ncbi:MAG: hypothetical protein QXP58_05240 [Thermoprotei archaeon]
MGSRGVCASKSCASQRAVGVDAGQTQSGRKGRLGLFLWASGTLILRVDVVKHCGCVYVKRSGLEETTPTVGVLGG